MRFSGHLLLLVIAFAIFGQVSCQSKVQDSHETVITEKSFDAAIAGDKLVMVDFYTTWCGPVKKWHLLFNSCVQLGQKMLWFANRCRGAG